jgi:hypothetical protein
MAATLTRRWTKERVSELAGRLRWELLNNTITSKQVIFAGGLTDRLRNYDSCTSNFSRWLRHTEEGDNAKLLKDDELERIWEWITKLRPVSRPDQLMRLLPNNISVIIQHWLTPHLNDPPKFHNNYVVYRPSAVAAERIVIGCLSISCDNQGHAVAVEKYKVIGAGLRSGDYQSEGTIVQSRERDLYLISRFSNGDLQTAVFTNIQKSGFGGNTIISMTGSVMSTMFKRPYTTRIYCEAVASLGNIDLDTATIDELPPHIRRTLTQPVEVSSHNIVCFT